MTFGNLSYMQDCYIFASKSFTKPKNNNDMKTVSENCDKNLIAALYTEHYDDLKRYLMNYTHDEASAEDMVQNLFIKVMSLDVLNKDTAKSLLYVMASRMIIDEARHRSFVKKLLSNYKLTMSSMESSSIVEHVHCNQIQALEETRLQDMAKQRALVYRMWRQDEMTASEIAEQLHLSKRTVENHLYISRKEMKDYLKRVI